MNYSYTTNNLFEEPEFYDYAQVDIDRIFHDWKDQRVNFSTRLQGIYDLSDSVASRQNADDANNSLSTILTAILHRNLDESEFQTEAGVLAALVAKFEIFRRLFSSYDNRLRKAEDAKPAALADYILFGEVLANECQGSESSRLLSSLLKLTDMLTSIPAERYTRDEASMLQHLLRKEGDLIDGWKNMVTGNA
jgi:hypothetical protein